MILNMVAVGVRVFIVLLIYLIQISDYGKL